MQNGSTYKHFEIILTCPDNTPFCFNIIISEAYQASGQCVFEVMGKDKFTSEVKTFVYQLRERDHNSYLNFFEKLAVDFGLRLPQNRQPQKKYHFEAEYRELLSKNIVPEMLYGYGDPAVIKVEDGINEKETWYYLVSTSNDAPNSFPICSSKDLIHWEFTGFIFSAGNKPKWAADGKLISDYWAPEIHKVRAEYRVYFVARHKNTFELCIGMARSSNPSGPYIADKAPMLKGNMIDPHVFVENDDTAYLFWKEDNNAIWPNLLIDLLCKHPWLIASLFTEKKDQVTASFIITLWPWIKTLNAMEAFLVQQIFIEAVTVSFSVFKEKLFQLVSNQRAHLRKDIVSLLEAMRTPVYAQKLSQDGSVLVEEKKLIIENDQFWEAHLVEGMWVTKHDNKFYLFYSGNDFSTDQYGIGVAISENLLGPYKKMSKPILKTTEQWWAPGHPSVAIGPDYKHYLFMHAFFPGKTGYKEFRALLSVPLEFKNEQVLLGSNKF